MPRIEGVFPDEPNFNFGLFSASKSGKSTQAVTFINNFHKYYPSTMVKKILIASPRYQKIYDSIYKKYGEKVRYFVDLNNELLEELEENGNNEVTIIFLDDLGASLAKNDAFLRMITIDTHHYRLCTIVCAHNIYQYNTNQWRTFIRNLHLIGLGNSVAQSQAVGKLFQQIFGPGGARYAREAREEAENIQKKRWDNPFYFLYLNLTPSCYFSHRVFCQPFTTLPIVLAHPLVKN